MKHSLIVFTAATILSFNFAFSAEAEKTTAVAPVITQDRKTNETIAGVFTADATPQNMNALDILRLELKTIQMREHERAQKDGVFWNTTKRFTPESLTFFVAIGAVTFNSMWMKSHGDPLAMERHILSLKDPIAHLSFYAFMQANGFYIHHRTKSMDPHTKAQAMRRLSYQGMAVGSLASSVVSDLGHSAKQCTDLWIRGKSDQQSVAACNEAWKNWTVRNKFTQYFPQIMSMWVAQAATELIDGTVRSAFQKGSASSFAQKILNKQWLINQAYKVTGADVAVNFTGGTWVIKGIKLVGKVTQFTMFVGLDHLLAPYTYRPLNNLIRPLFVDFDIYDLNKFWTAMDDGNWDESKVPEVTQFCRTPTPIPSAMFYRCKSDSSLEKEIENYSMQMQQWREHLNSDVETDLAGWMEMTKKLLNQVDYAYQFYRSFSNNLFETLNAGHRIQTKEADASIMKNKSNYPFRTLPLYGVSMGDIQISGGSANDLYLNRPFEIEKRQLEHIKHVVAEYIKAGAQLPGKAAETYKGILAKLSDSNINIISSGLNDINLVLKNGSLEKNSNAHVQHDIHSKSGLFVILKQLHKHLGSPQPVVYPLAGFTQAFAVNDIYKLTAGEADYSLWSVSKKYKFNKETDLMLYKIICGNSVSSFDKTTLLGKDMMMPQFDPPTLLKNSESRSDFCKSTRTTDNLYSTEIGGQSLRDHLLANLNYQALGDFSNQNTLGQFDKWWLVNGKAPAMTIFKEYDKKFEKLIELTRQNMFDQKSFFKFFVDHLNQSRYLKSNLRDQMNVELEFYLQLIQRALTKEVKQDVKKDILGFKNYMQLVVDKSSQETFTGINGVTYTEVQRLSKLLKDYNLLTGQITTTQFEKYISQSKKIDDAINDVLVAAGFKTVELKKVNQSDDLLSDSSATEVTEKVYTDLKIEKLSARQKVILAAVKGLRQLESENRRFIRMRIMLSQSLDLDMQEFMSDWNNKSAGQLENTSVRGANPRGGK